MTVSDTGTWELSTGLGAIEGMTDAQAIGASLADPEVFAVLFDRHFDAIHRYAQRRVGRDLADEIAAETFTRAFDRRRRYDTAREDARPWLLGIAANLLRRHWRTEKRRLDAYARSTVRPGGTRRSVDQLPRHRLDNQSRRHISRDDYQAKGGNLGHLHVGRRYNDSAGNPPGRSRPQKLQRSRLVQV